MTVEAFEVEVFMLIPADCTLLNNIKRTNIDKMSLKYDIMIVLGVVYDFRDTVETQQSKR